MSAKKYQRLEFTPAEDEFLTEKVRENPPLYEKKLKTYKDIQLRENIWTKIQKEMEKAGYNRTVEDCKKRWTNVRDYYTRRKRGSTTGSGAHDMKGCLKNLKFLDENTTVHRPTTSNIAACSVEVEENEENETELLHAVGAPIATTATTQIATTSTVNNNIETSINGTRKRTWSQVLDSIEEGREERMKLLRYLVNTKEQQAGDHIDSYFKSLADIAKTWPPLYYAQARGKISNLVNELDIEYLSSNTNNRAEDDDSE